MKNIMGKKKAKGFTLFELVIVLVAGGLILAWAAGKGAEMWEGFKVTRMTDDVNSISEAVVGKYGNKASYAGVSMTDLGKRTEFGDGVGQNPWKGDYTVSPGTEPRTYIITSNKMVESNGLKAVDKYKNATYNAGTETVSITFGK